MPIDRHLKRWNPNLNSYTSGGFRVGVKAVAPLDWIFLSKQVYVLPVCGIHLPLFLDGKVQTWVAPPPTMKIFWILYCTLNVILSTWPSVDFYFTSQSLNHLYYYHLFILL